MHGDINTRDRYTTCQTCGKAAARDTQLGWCVNTGCVDYFGTRTATAKAPAIEAVLTTLTGKDRPATIAALGCTTCKEGVTTFRDPLSAREYTISGMCQRCQDRVFGTGEE